MADNKQLVSIQVLRALAALAVTVAHTHAESLRVAAMIGVPSGLPTLVTGAAGVDLFFVISGFVMVYASAFLFGSLPGAGRFLIRRIIRIAPIYWIATTVTVACWLLVVGTSLKQQGLDVQDFVTSFLFIPHARADGTWLPILGIGWSLNYEMFFYLLFGAFMVLPRRSAVLSLSAFMVYFVYAGSQNYLTALPPQILHFANTTILEFTLGMLIGLVYCEGIRLPVWAAWVVGVAGVLILAATATWDEAMIFRREIMWGGPSALMLIGATFAGQPRVTGFWRPWILIGNASYSLYLFHGMVMMAPRFVAPAFAKWCEQWPWLYVAFLTATSVISAIVIHLLLEQPLTRTLRRLVTRRGSEAVSPKLSTATSAAD
jgi:exopolysaccharide production protein ExoZ